MGGRGPKPRGVALNDSRSGSETPPTHDDRTDDRTPLTSTSQLSAERLSTTVGVVTVFAGCALVGAPNHTGPLIGLSVKRDAQLVGVLDLALSPGLILGRPRWPWMAARAACDLLTAAFALQRAGCGASRRNARAFSAFLVVATLADLRALRALGRNGLA